MTNNFQNQHWNQNQQNNQNHQSQTGQGQQQTNNQTQQSQPNQQPPGLMQTLMATALPALIQHFTGQQMPSSNGNSPESQLMLSQILMLQQQIITGQQDLAKRIFNLEISASQQLTNINQQVQNLKSIRLSHSKETKQVDYNLQQEYKDGETDSNKY